MRIREKLMFSSSSSMLGDDAVKK